MVAKDTGNAYGLVTLTGMTVQYADDAFELRFRMPLRQTISLDLATNTPADMAVHLMRQLAFLRPQWLDTTYTLQAPPGLADNAPLVVPSGDDVGDFDQTLIAYCMGYDLNPANIRYTVDYYVEDAPEFRLLSPAETASYSVLELLAVLRALRYNEAFHAISFAGINLGALHNLRDRYGTDHVTWTSRSGIDVIQYFDLQVSNKSLLYQEIQAIALKSRRLRRLDFTNTLPKRRPRDGFENGPSKDPGCEIASALLPLCCHQVTNVDWLVLSGIELGETDLDELGKYTPSQVVPLRD
jgi:hypothetical protein